MGGFFKRDMVTGEVVDAIQIPEGSPFPHGMSVWNGYIYWTDDIGGGKAPVCRTKISDPVPATRRARRWRDRPAVSRAGAGRRGRADS